MTANANTGSSQTTTFGGPARSSGRRGHRRASRSTPFAPMAMNAPGSAKNVTTFRPCARPIRKIARPNANAPSGAASMSCSLLRNVPERSFASTRWPKQKQAPAQTPAPSQ